VTRQTSRRDAQLSGRRYAAKELAGKRKHPQETHEQPSRRHPTKQTIKQSEPKHAASERMPVQPKPAYAETERSTSGLNGHWSQPGPSAPR
jgi:hypothetical protein